MVLGQGFAYVQLQDGSWTFVDREGKLQEGRYKEVGHYCEGFAWVQLKDGFWTFVDKEGKLQEGRYLGVGKYSEGFAHVQLQDDSYTFVDREGKLQEGRYKDAGYYSEGFAVVQLQDGSWTFVDKEGKLQNGRYQEAYHYSEGFAAVQLEDGCLCYVNKDGELSLSLEKWKSLLEKDPTMFEYIPLHRFADEEFLKEINAVVKRVLINYVEKVGAYKYVRDIMKLIEEKTKTAKKKIGQFVEEIKTTHDIEEKVGKEELLSQIEDFFDEKDE